MTEKSFIDVISKLVEGEQIIITCIEHDLIFEFKTFGSTTHTASTKMKFSKEMIKLEYKHNRLENKLYSIIDGLIELTEENIKKMNKQQLKVELYNQLMSMSLQEMSLEEIALKVILKQDEEVQQVIGKPEKDVR